MSFTRAEFVAMPWMDPVAAPTADPARADLGGILRRDDTGSGSLHVWPTAVAVVLAHLIAIGALLQVEAVRAAAREVAPTWVTFIPAPQTPPVVPPPARPQTALATPPAQPRQTPPQVIAAQPTVPEAADSVAAAQPEPTAAPVVAAAPASMPPPSPPATPRIVPASAVQYLVQPPIEVPLGSRRLGEQGTVWLRVHVGRDGLPQQISVQKSSGFDRLDRQALDAMRQARFKPQTENGQPIEWIVTAPLQYEID